MSPPIPDSHRWRNRDGVCNNGKEVLANRNLGMPTASLSRKQGGANRRPQDIKYCLRYTRNIAPPDFWIASSVKLLLS